MEELADLRRRVGKWVGRSYGWGVGKRKRKEKRRRGQNWRMQKQESEDDEHMGMECDCSRQNSYAGIVLCSGVDGPNTPLAVVRTGALISLAHFEQRIEGIAII